MTIRESISIVKRLFREVNADSRLTNKAVYSIIQKHCKWLIYRDSDKLKLLKKHKIYQTSKCLKVIEAPSIDSCCGLKSNKCKIFRTEEKIPELYEDSSGVIIHNITSIDALKSTDIDFTTIAQARRQLNNPWKGVSKSKIYAFYNDGYIYFPTENHLKLIEVEGLFLKEINPEENCDPCKDCKPKCKRFLDTNLILPDYLEAQVFDAVIKDMANTYKRIPEKSQEINKDDNLSR